jgi:ketosteroid isomerase-like protein
VNSTACTLLIDMNSATQLTEHQRTGASDDIAMVYMLDDLYQSAVKRNDAAAMDRILTDDFVLVTGLGKVIGKAELLHEAREAKTSYERQEDSQKAVRLVGKDTAVVTALLWVKGVSGDETFDYSLWFSDIYLRTSTGWRYAFAQASMRMPSVL